MLPVHGNVQNDNTHCMLLKINVQKLQYI